MMIDFLKKQGLTESQIAELLSKSETFTAKKRSILLKEQETSSYIYFVESGILRTGIHDADNKDWTHFFYSCEGLKWAGLSSNTLLEKPSDYFIEVLEDAQITAFPLAHFRALRRSSLVWSRFFHCQLMTTFFYLEQKSARQLKFSPKKRYVDFIEANSYIVQNIPQHYIASYIGVAPESLSRIRKRLNDSVIFS